MITTPGGDWMERGYPPAGDDSAATAENAAADALTCIRDGVYTPAPRAATAEIDDLMIKNLIKALAEVAMAVASRMRIA